MRRLLGLMTAFGIVSALASSPAGAADGRFVRFGAARPGLAPKGLRVRPVVGHLRLRGPGLALHGHRRLRTWPVFLHTGSEREIVIIQQTTVVVPQGTPALAASQGDWPAVAGIWRAPPAEPIILVAGESPDKTWTVAAASARPQPQAPGPKIITIGHDGTPASMGVPTGLRILDLRMAAGQ